MATTPVPTSAGSVPPTSVTRPAQTAQELAAAKLKLAANAATAAKTKIAPILSTSKVSTVAPKPVTLPPGIDFAALRAADPAYKLKPGIDFAALKKQQDEAAFKAGTLKLPPGINFAGLKAMTDAKKPPVDPLQDVYNKFTETMKIQGKDTTALYDKVMKEITAMYGTANKETDTNYAPTLKALKDMVNNVGGPANANSIAEVPANIAWLKSANASNLAGVKSSIDMLKGSIPDMFASIATGTQGNLQQAMLDRAAMMQAAAAAKAGGGGGGGGGGGRRRSGGGGGGGGSSSGANTTTAAGSETYNQYNLGDVAARASLSPGERALFDSVYNNSGRNINSSIAAANRAAEAHQAQVWRGGIPNLLGGNGSKNLAKARNSKAQAAQAKAWRDVVNVLSGISGSMGSARGARQTKDSSSQKTKHY